MQDAVPLFQFLCQNEWGKISASYGEGFVDYEQNIWHKSYNFKAAVVNVTEMDVNFWRWRKKVENKKWW